MMSAIANSLPKPEGFKLYVRKFRAICVMHNVPFGSRNNLPGFVQKLVEDRPLAMEFWKLIGKLSNREGGDLSDDQLLTVVVESVAGGEISLEDGELKRAIGDLRAMLAGVDIQTPGQGQVELAPFPPSETGQWQRGEAARIHAVEPSPRSPDPHGGFASGTVDEEAGHTAEPAPPLQLDEARLRLELSRLVKLYLDEIEKNRQQPGPDGAAAASMGPIANATTRRSLEEPQQNETDELTHRPTGKSRLVLESSDPAIESPYAHLKDYLPSHIPLESYSQPEGFGRAISSLLLVLALAATAFAGYRYRMLLRVEMDNLIQKVQKRDTVVSASPNAPSAPALDDTSTQQAQPQSAASQPALQGTSTQPPPNTGDGNSPAPTASIKPQPAAGGVDSSSSHKALMDHAVIQAQQASSVGITSAEEAGAVRVDPVVMEDSLLVSRVPVYPDAAKESRVQGVVVMQAIISKDGMVKHVHVVQGDSRLRGAAMESLFKRRYRPYLLNGQPVDVSTTITVDFNLDR
jgi:TonB family protein